MSTGDLKPSAPATSPAKGPCPFELSGSLLLTVTDCSTHAPGAVESSLAWILTPTASMRWFGGHRLPTLVETFTEGGTSSLTVRVTETSTVSLAVSVPSETVSVTFVTPTGKVAVGVALVGSSKTTPSGALQR